MQGKMSTHAVDAVGRRGVGVEHWLLRRFPRREYGLLHTSVGGCNGRNTSLFLFSVLGARALRPCEGASTNREIKNTRPRVMSSLRSDSEIRYRI